MGKRYVAYVGSYTFIGKSKGITIYDVDVDAGRFTKRDEVEINNSSYLAVSHSRKYLYSVVDEGIASFRILEDGGLEQMNIVSAQGMRGCYLFIDPTDRYIFISGYHDGKLTVLKIHENGSLGGITDFVFHKGIGSVAEKTHQPHISCVMMTPDCKYVCAVDSGIDQIKVYSFNYETGKLALADIVRGDLESAPHHMLFSNDGRFMYVVCELKNHICVYSYDGSGSIPEFELVQRIFTVRRNASSVSAACAIEMTSDNRYLFCSNAGDNSVCMFKRDAETGRLSVMRILPISGDYPKDIGLFPDDRHLFSVNHESGSLTFFTVNYEKGLIIMNQVPITVDEPNCGLVVELP